VTNNDVEAEEQFLVNSKKLKREAEIEKELQEKLKTGEVQGWTYQARN
jgi:hypothetical protein